MASLERPFESWRKAEEKNKKMTAIFEVAVIVDFPKSYCVNANEEMISEKTDDSVVILKAGGGVV